MRQRLIHSLETAARWIRQPLLMQVIYPTCLMVLLMGMSSVLYWNALVDQEQRLAHATLSAKAQDLLLEVESRMRGYRQILRGARALFNASTVVTEQEWQVYVSNLDLHEEFSGLIGVGFARSMTPPQRLLYNARMREQRKLQQQLWPGGARPHFSAIMFLEPRHPFNQLALGYDMLSEERRRQAMWQAARENRSIVTAPVMLVQERAFQNKALGMLMYLPVYEEHPPPLDEQQRLKMLQGWVYMPFRMAELMSRLTSYLPPETRLSLYDGQDLTAAKRYWSNNAQLDRLEATFPPLTRHTQRLYTNGRIWTFDLMIPLVTENLRAERHQTLGMLTIINLLVVGIALALATARYRASQLMYFSHRLNRSQQGYRTVVELSNEGMAAVNEQLSLVFVNRQLVDMLQASVTQLSQKPLSLIWMFDEQFCEAELLEQLRRGQRVRREIRLQRIGAPPLNVLVSVSPLLEQATFRGATLIFADISQLKEREAQVSYLARHDGLTGLLNRSAFQEHMVQVWEESRRYGRRFGLLYLDLDMFKPINDTYGHAAGDHVLVEVSRRMSACVRRSDVVGRRGGDEFVVLLPELGSPALAQVVAEKLRATLSEPIQLSELSIQVGCSIGIATFPEAGEDIDTLVAEADRAMYQAKQAGGNRLAHRHPPNPSQDPESVPS